MEFTSAGTYLEVKAHSENTWKKAYGLFSTPAMGGSREKIDVTNLNDSHKRNVDGIADYGSLEFSFYDTKNEEDTSTEIRKTYSTFRTWDVARTELDFRLVYPDGTGFTWSGTVSVQKESASVNSAIQFKVYTSLSTELTDYTVSTAVSGGGTV